MEESLQEPESRMGVAFHARRDDFVPRLGSGASTSTVIRDDASGSSAHGDGEHAHGEHARGGHAYAHANHGVSKVRGEDETEDVLRRHLAELMARREEARRAADATPTSETTRWSMKVKRFAADRGFEADDAMEGDEPVLRAAGLDVTERSLLIRRRAASRRRRATREAKDGSCTRAPRTANLGALCNIATHRLHTPSRGAKRRDE